MEEGLEAKLARWRRQAEELRLQDKDSAVSRARASRLSRTDEEEQDPVLDDDLVGGPLGSPRRTVCTHTSHTYVIIYVRIHTPAGRHVCVCVRVCVCVCVCACVCVCV